MNPWLWGGGAVAAGGLLWAVTRGGGGSSEPASDNTVPDSTPMAAPLFMASGGGSNQSATNDPNLGGDAWKPPVIPISENADVAIARINSDTAKYAIDRAAELQNAAVQELPSQTPAVSTSRASEWRGNSISQGAAYIKDVVSKAGNTGMEAAERAIYAAAKSGNYSASEVAQSYSEATGVKTTATQVGDWLKSRGLSL